MSTPGYGKLVVFYVGSTLQVQLDGLHLEKDEDADGNPSTYQNDATVTVEELKDTAGNNVSGVTLPITLSYVTSSDGKYRGNIGYGAGLVVGTEYRCLVLVIASGGERLKLMMQGKAVYAGG